MFLRPGVQRDYSEGEKVFFVCGNNVELLLVVDSLKMKRFLIDEILLTECEVCTRGKYRPARSWQ